MKGWPTRYAVADWPTDVMPRAWPYDPWWQIALDQVDRSPIWQGIAAWGAELDSRHIGPGPLPWWPLRRWLWWLRGIDLRRRYWDARFYCASNMWITRLRYSGRNLYIVVVLCRSNGLTRHPPCRRFGRCPS